MYKHLILVAAAIGLALVVALRPRAAGDERPAVTRFSAAEVGAWRAKAGALSQLPKNTPEGWSKSRVDPARLLTAFPALRLREGYVWRAYVFKEDGNSNGFVWALPAGAAYLEPDECPRVESHFLHPPKPFDALDDLMEAIEGDDTPASYLQASILRREVKEFGSGWHGVKWGMHRVLDNHPWHGAQAAGDDSMALYPTSEPREWKWLSPRPTAWAPEVRIEPDRATVTFYTYTALYAEGDGDTLEKERIVRHTDTYRRGKYRALVVEQKVAEGPNAIAH